MMSTTAQKPAVMLFSLHAEKSGISYFNELQRFNRKRLEKCSQKHKPVAVAVETLDPNRTRPKLPCHALLVTSGKNSLKIQKEQHFSHLGGYGEAVFRDRDGGQTEIYNQGMRNK